MRFNFQRRFNFGWKKKRVGSNRSPLVHTLKYLSMSPHTLHSLNDEEEFTQGSRNLGLLGTDWAMLL